MTGFGHHISLSHRRSKRRFDPTIQRKRYWLPSEGRHVRLTPTVGFVRGTDVDVVRAGRWTH
ncbi:bL28 family ribosomal protein [Streptomyces sp. NPDC050287]|uniref:bL28 family ribosomal protein n=1 Tax=Streptomyces sp. NPDC050287 TaxID=3365608 RepID=UPI0037AEDF82